VLTISCSTNEEDSINGKLKFEINHIVNGEPLKTDQMIYTNAAGNQYEISEIQWFISDVSLIDSENNSRLLSQSDWIHYIDTDLPETHIWTIMEDVNPGKYKAVKFIFGIKGEKNVPMMFTDPPESNMIWSYHMGGDEGGYHYMKLNGFWIDDNTERSPFNFHIGVGQIYDDNLNITGYVQNWIEVRLPLSSFTMPEGGTITATLNMNIENWFRNPHIYDHNVYGGSIMNNQEALDQISENGHDVFTVVIK
jgi:hypothetical protein